MTIAVKDAANATVVIKVLDDVFGPATLVDVSGTIANGGAAQTIAAPNANRRGFMLQNQSGADLWISTNAVAFIGQPSFRISPYALYETPAHGFGTGAISIIGATTGQAFSGRTW